MTKTAAKQKIANEVKMARIWTKNYLEDLNDAIATGDWAAAEYIASQLAPIWGEIENTIIDIRNMEEGVA
jgi:iron uptake system EfeUOB component EfeO/EfeM